MESTIYPEFVGIPSSGSSHIHLTYDGIYLMIMSLRKNGSEISSVCSYDYLGKIFYIINAINEKEQSEIALNMTMDELEKKAEEMTNRRMKARHICKGHHNRFHAVWHHTSSPRHFIIQAGFLTDILLKDIQQGERGYYPTCLQVYRAINGTSALIIWEKGYGVRYRIQNGHSLSGLLEEMSNSTLYPSTISILPRNKSGTKTTIYIVWRGSEFSWYDKNIPISERSNSFAHKKKEELKMAVERQATPLNSYRIASISKTITAMGIVELVNEGRLDMESNVSKKTYEQYIQESVFIPNRIEGFIGKSERVNKEVCYYSPDNANPYTYWMPFRLDSAAGWVMTAEQVRIKMREDEEKREVKYKSGGQSLPLIGAREVWSIPASDEEKFSQTQLWQRIAVMNVGEDGSLFHLGSLAGSEGIAYTKGAIQVSILTNVRGRQQNVQTSWMEQICRLIAQEGNK
uniref:Beta-lactamase domain-containing protein n=1 Tax=Heterorhabditis bacteriophora TaxID=37862 RepID=A0A1I7XMP9_HETBA